jgi:PAS domain S-box-containing protein
MLVLPIDSLSQMEYSEILPPSNDPLATLLHDDHEVLSLLYDNTSDYFLLVDRQLQIQLYNQVTYDQLLLHRRIAIRRGLSVLTLSEPARHGQLMSVYNDVLRGEKRETKIEVRSEHDGKVRYLHNYIFPARNKAGDIIALMVISHDETEKKQVELALASSEERWRFALEGSNLGLWDRDLTSDQIYFSPSYHRLYGFPEGSLRPNINEWATRVHPDDMKGLQENVVRHLHGETPMYESMYRMQDAQGRYRWINARGMIVSHGPNGEPTRMIGTHDDVTKMVEAEKALQRSHERFLLATRATSDAIYDWNILSDGLVWGEGLHTLFGHNLDEVDIQQWESFIHIQDRERILNSLDQLLEGSDDYWKGEYRFQKKDGSFSHVLDRGYIVRDPSGKPVRMIGAVQDVTEQRERERSLLESELNRQKLISQATTETQEKERAGIGKELHDNVNQVLTTTKLYLDLSISNPELRDDLIRKCSENVIYVINEIRQLSRSLMNPSLGDLGLVDAISDLVENTNLTRKLKVDVDVDPDIDIYLNEHQKLMFFRILQEALSNALRHSAATELGIRLHPQSKKVELLVSDNGSGFDPGHVKKGAGLRNIENRVYLSDGTLQVVSEPGKGCTLIIHIPMKTN